MLEPLSVSERNRLLAAMGEVERLIRAASLKVAAESPDSADARLCLNAYFRELAARFENGFDADADDPARVADMSPPSGLFVIARLDGAAVGCGGFKRVDKAIAEIKRVWTAPSARGLGVARRMLRTLEAAAREAGVNTLRLRHQSGADRGARALPERRIPGNRPFQRQPLCPSLVREGALAATVRPRWSDP